MKRIVLINMPKAIIYQCKNYGLIDGFFIDKNSRGIFSIRSHIKTNGKEKVCYNTEETAIKSAETMNKKYNKNTLVAYKCGYCNGYHVGNNK